MKLLLDENLSRKLVSPISELFPGFAHVSDYELLACADQEARADAQSRMASTLETSDKGRAARAATRTVRLAELDSDPELAVLVLDRI